LRRWAWSRERPKREKGEKGGSQPPPPLGFTPHISGISKENSFPNIQHVFASMSSIIDSALKETKLGRGKPFLCARSQFGVDFIKNY